MSPTWHDTNEQYLAIALDRVRMALQNYLGKIQDQPAVAPLPSLPAVDPSAVPTLHNLCVVFNLSSFERDLLMLCVGIELSGALAHLCGTAQGGAHLTYPTFSLALAVLPEPDWSAITPVSSLRYWRLIEVSNGDSLTQSRLRIDERVLHYLNGISYLDDRLRGLVEPYSVQVTLPTSQQQLVSQIVERYSQTTGSPPLIQLWGEERESKGAIATTACQSLRLKLHILRATDLPTPAAEREALARLWEREALLSHSALLVDCEENDHASPLLPFLEALPSPLIVASRDPLTLRRPNLRLEVQKPTPVEQGELWKVALADRFPSLNGHLEPLVAQFNLSAAAIHDIGAAIANDSVTKSATKFSTNFAASHTINSLTNSVTNSIEQRETGVFAPLEPEPAIAAVWNACRSHARTRLDDLAQRIPAIAAWEELKPNAKRSGKSSPRCGSAPPCMTPGNLLCGGRMGWGLVPCLRAPVGQGRRWRQRCWPMSCS
jgi:hypothetical protein